MNIFENHEIDILYLQNKEEQEVDKLIKKYVSEGYSILYHIKVEGERHGNVMLKKKVGFDPKIND